MSVKCGVFRLSGRLAFRFQVLEQSVECFLIGVVVFPAAKVANVPCPPNVGGPGPICLHHGIVNPDGKQNGVVRCLFVKSRLDFLLYPLAVDRVLGEDK